jgi:5-(carboxyamino)imidazole ribonucleotide synthase
MSENKKLRVGILGAGQLARMMILNTRHLGVQFVLFCEKKTQTTKNLADHFEASLEDKEALKKFCAEVDVVTFESENYEEELVEFVENLKPLYPPKKALLVAQDRLKEKTLAKELKIPTNEFIKIESYADLLDASQKLGFPLILKARRFGYDGKLQFHLKEKKDLLALENENLEGFLAESFVPFSYEVSLIAVRGVCGEVRFYDLCRNHHENGILRETRNIKNKKLFAQAKEHMQKIMEHLNYTGVLTLEFFVLEEELLFNEMAPRVHNSGHWTIEGAEVSQFENHIRAVLGLPLGSTESSGSYRMLNCISEMYDRNQILLEDGYYHDYEKEPRKNRKLGHVTFSS